MSLVARCTPSSWMEPLIVPETGIMSAPRKRTISELLSTQVSSLARRLEGCDIRHIQRETGDDRLILNLYFQDGIMPTLTPTMPIVPTKGSAAFKKLLISYDC